MIISIQLVTNKASFFVKRLIKISSISFIRHNTFTGHITDIQCVFEFVDAIKEKKTNKQKTTSRTYI